MPSYYCLVANKWRKRPAPQHKAELKSEASSHTPKRETTSPIPKLEEESPATARLAAPAPAPASTHATGTIITRAPTTTPPRMRNSTSTTATTSPTTTTTTTTTTPTSKPWRSDSKTMHRHPLHAMKPGFVSTARSSTSVVKEEAKAGAVDHEDVQDAKHFMASSSSSSDAHPRVPHFYRRVFFGGPG